jgi:hypothetical protein
MKHRQILAANRKAREKIRFTRDLPAHHPDCACFRPAHAVTLITIKSRFQEKRLTPARLTRQFSVEEG